MFLTTLKFLLSFCCVIDFFVPVEAKMAQFQKTLTPLMVPIFDFYVGLCREFQLFETQAINLKTFVSKVVDRAELCESASVQIIAILGAWKSCIIGSVGAQQQSVYAHTLRTLKYYENEAQRIFSLITQLKEMGVYLKDNMDTLSAAKVRIAKENFLITVSDSTAASQFFYDNFYLITQLKREPEGPIRRCRSSPL